MFTSLEKIIFYFFKKKLSNKCMIFVKNNHFAIISYKYKYFKNQQQFFINLR